MSLHEHTPLVCDTAINRVEHLGAPRPNQASQSDNLDHVTGKLVQQRIESDHGHLKSRLRSMRWFKTDRTAGLFCRAHGFIRNLQDGFYEWGIVLGDPRIPRAPRLVLAWDELTQDLQAA